MSDSGKVELDLEEYLCLLRRDLDYRKLKKIFFWLVEHEGSVALDKTENPNKDDNSPWYFLSAGDSWFTCTNGNELWDHLLERFP